MLELVEASFDEVSRLVSLEVIRDEPLSGGIAGNDSLGSHICNELAQSIGIISLVSENLARRKSVEKSRCLSDVTTLTGGEDHLERSSLAVRGYVDLGGQSTSGTPPKPDFGPPFSGRGLLVCANQGAVEHDRVIVGIVDKVG